MFRGIRAKLSAFGADTRGVVFYLAVLLLVPLVMLIGVAMDVGQLLTVKKQLWGAIDAAALDIGATPGISQADARAQAQSFIGANFSTQYPNAALSSLIVIAPQAQSTANCPANTVCITASATVNTAFVKLFGAQYNVLSTTVSTQVAVPQQSYCMLTLDPAGWSQYGGPAAGLELVGGPTLTMNGCGIAVNATGSQALMVDSGASLTSPSATIVGQLADPWADGRVQITNLKQNQSPVADPYSSVQIPASSGSCLTNTYSYAATQQTLQPGRYCNGLWIQNDANVLLSPGIYYIESGQFSVAGGASISGSGVTIVLTTGDGGNTYATLSITNGTNLILSAPTSGQTAGILFFGDRNAPSSNINYISGFTYINWTGVIYLPTQKLSYASSGTVTGCQQAIAWDIKDALTNLTFDGTCTGTGMNTLSASSPILIK